MPYDARVLQILIASPGDVQEEREIMAEVIYEWNYVNSRERSIVLLPLRWETHASPEMGTGPQAVINRQVVIHCDMAVGTFWTRLGTPTSEAESGTAEEIARVGDAGKPVMLYFSRAKVDLETIDLDEYGRLKEFKKRSYPNGLIESYSSANDFREKFRRQLAIRIRDLIAEDSLEQSRTLTDDRSIVLTFGEGHPLAILSPPNVLRLTPAICVDKDEIPYYYHYSERDNSGDNLRGVAVGTGYNRNYYRESIDYFCEQSNRRGLRLAVSSTSNQSVRDIYLEIKTRVINGGISINPPQLSWPPEKWLGISRTVTSQYYMAEGQGRLSIENISANEWRMEVSIPIVQTHRTVFSSNEFELKAAESSTVAFDATVYSSDALPFSLSTELEVVVEPREMSYRDILKQVDPDYNKNEK
jgi:hypothetical protein